MCFNLHGQRLKYTFYLKLHSKYAIFIQKILRDFISYHFCSISALTVTFNKGLLETGVEGISSL